MRGFLTLLAVLSISAAAPTQDHAAVLPRPADLRWRGHLASVLPIAAAVLALAAVSVASGAPLLLAVPLAWRQLQVADREAAGLSLSDAEQTAKIALPRDHMISRVFFRVRATHATSVDLVGKKVQVVANGNGLLFDAEWEDMRALAKFESGSVPEDAAAGTTTHLDGVINFGRFPRDTRVILPAKIFRTLELRLAVDPNAVPTAFDVSVWVEEYVSDDDPRSKLLKRVTLVNTKSISANDKYRVDLTTPHLVRAIILHADDVDNLLGEVIKVKVNGGTEEPFSARADQLREVNEQTYRFDDGNIHTVSDEVWLRIDFDVLEDLAGVLDGSRISKLELELKAAGSGTAGENAVLMEELLAVA